MKLLAKILALAWLVQPPLLGAQVESGKAAGSSPPSLSELLVPGGLESAGGLDLGDEPASAILERPATDAWMEAAAIEEEDDGYEWKPFTLSLGGQLLATVNTTLRVDSSTLGTGTEIDLEDDFDVDDRLFAGRIDAEWRIAKRHALDFSVYDLQRKGTRVIDRDIQIGNVVFPVNTEVTNEFENLIVKLAYRYSIIHRTRWHAGASLGLHTMAWKTEWKTTAGAGQQEDFDFTAPLPVVGLFGSYALTPKLYLNAASEFFGLEYEEFDGFLNNTRLSLEHRTFEHVGFGIGLDYFLIDATLDSESGSLDAEAEYDYVGLMAFMRIY